MPWFSVHAIMRVAIKANAEATEITVWENVYLVEASSAGAAASKAEGVARAFEGDDNGSFVWDGEPARWVFAGIRKVIACSDEVPVSGTEITYTQYTLRSEQALRALVDGDRVDITYDDERPREE
jgi:hypothetical protein